MLKAAGETEKVVNDELLTSEVRAWLSSRGWFPGRDIGTHADEFIKIRLEDAERHSVTLIPTANAVRFIRSYGELRLIHPVDPESGWIMDPTFGYDGDAANIKELSFELDTELFPVGYDALEYGIILVDETGRFFQLHHTGGYYMGANEADAFSRLLAGVSPADAEDYFV
ncbi:SUKH-3 domain-containing protein [Streptomyces sp. NPDC052095]|uniref:SUKH-3 domain-containing protein n=1 Tax=unclassified Streptomyces TaxID=2593676 RepID=UPI00344BCDC6